MGCPPINIILCPLLLFSTAFFLRLLSSSTLCVPSLLLSETLEFPDGDLLRFDGVYLAICNPCLSLTFGTYSLCLVLFFSVFWCCWFVWASVVCDWVFCQLLCEGFDCVLRVSVAPLCVFLWVGGFLLG